jgi:hypothetical protein
MSLLSWLAFAKRPLKLREIQVLKSINMENRDVDFDRRKFQEPQRRIKDLCESLVEIEEDQTVNFVHLSAKL